MPATISGNRDTVDGVCLAKQLPQFVGLQHGGFPVIPCARLENDGEYEVVMEDRYSAP